MLDADSISWYNVYIIMHKGSRLHFTVHKSKGGTPMFNIAILEDDAAAAKSLQYMPSAPFTTLS